MQGLAVGRWQSAHYCHHEAEHWQHGVCSIFVTARGNELIIPHGQTIFQTAQPRDLPPPPTPDGHLMTAPAAFYGTLDCGGHACEKPHSFLRAPARRQVRRPPASCPPALLSCLRSSTQRRPTTATVPRPSRVRPKLALTSATGIPPGWGRMLAQVPRHNPKSPPVGRFL